MILKLVAVGALAYHVDLICRIHAESILGLSLHQYHVSEAVEDHMIHVVAAAILNHAFTLQHDARVVGLAAILLDCIYIKESAGFAGVIIIKGVAQSLGRSCDALPAARIQNCVGLLIDVQGHITLVAPAVGEVVTFGLILLVVKAEDELPVEFVVVVKNLCVVALQLETMISSVSDDFLSRSESGAQISFAAAEHLGAPQVSVCLDGKGCVLIPENTAAGDCG